MTRQDSNLSDRDRHATAAPVLVLNWNGWDDTIRLVGELHRLHEVGEVWVIDNGSERDRCGEIVELFPGVRTFRWDQNYGFAGGYNRALHHAMYEGYEFVYLLNNDTNPTPGFLRNALALMIDRPHAATVGSCIGYSAASGYLRFDGEYHEIAKRPAGAVREAYTVPDVNGAGMLIRLEAVARHGGFDERFFCYGEEAEWCWRMWDGGWSCWMAGNSTILHSCEGSDVNGNAQYYRVRNRFLWLEGVAESDRKLLKQQIVYEAAVFAEQARRRRNLELFLSTATGLADGLASRFGKRRSRRAGTDALLLLCWVWMCATVRDKLRQRRNLPCGYGVSVRCLRSARWSTINVTS